MRWPRKKDFSANRKAGINEADHAHERMEPVVKKKSSVEEQSHTARQSPVECLTPRERDVFELLIKGRKLQEAADELGVKYSTANTHQKSVYKKLGVNSRAECILRYGKPGEE